MHMPTETQLAMQIHWDCGPLILAVTLEQAAK
jgi:hypothetical protein